MTKRITMPIDGNIDSIKRTLQEKLGMQLSYHQVIDYLIKFYRDKQPVKTEFRMNKDDLNER